MHVTKHRSHNPISNSEFVIDGTIAGPVAFTGNGHGQRAGRMPAPSKSNSYSQTAVGVTVH